MKQNHPSSRPPYPDPWYKQNTTTKKILSLCYIWRNEQSQSQKRKAAPIIKSYEENDEPIDVADVPSTLAVQVTRYMKKIN
jgi:hypothetical protein